MSTIAEREAAANLKALDRAQRDRSTLLEAIRCALKQIEEGKPLVDMLATLSNAIAKVENRKEAAHAEEATH